VLKWRLLNYTPMTAIIRFPLTELILKRDTQNNIVIVSNRANRIKSDETEKEIRKVADFL